MQTRKKVSSRNGVEELSSPRYRQHKKMSEHAQVAETKVADLITSSTRKPRYGTLPKKTRDIKNVKKVKASYILAGDEDQEICLLYDTIDGVSIGHQGFDERNADCEDTLFSPTYHVTKDAVGLTPNRADFVEVFKGDDKTCHLQTKDLRVNITNCPASFESSDSLGREDHRNPIDDVITDARPTFPCNMNMDSSVVYSKETDISNCNEYKLGDNLSSEVSAIYLAMQQSKLECVDEISEDSMSVEVNVEADEDDEVDDFDPYLFIRNLPELSAVVPTFRPMLLPKQTRRCPPTTLVLDLDETLVHSSLEHCDNADFTFQVNFNLMQHTVYVRCRPHLKDFMERVASLFEIIVFTASQSVYAEQLLNVLDPKRRLFRHRVFRDSCVFVEGNYLKDLSVLGRDLARVVIIDNSPQAFGFQVDNGVPILSWFQDPSDCELLELLPFLESLVGVEDVRPIIAKRFNLREKVASAVDPFNRLE